MPTYLSKFDLPYIKKKHARCFLACHQPLATLCMYVQSKLLFQHPPLFKVLPCPCRKSSFPLRTLSYLTPKSVLITTTTLIPDSVATTITAVLFLISFFFIFISQLKHHCFIFMYVYIPDCFSSFFLFFFFCQSYHHI